MRAFILFLILLIIVNFKNSNGIYIHTEDKEAVKIAPPNFQIIYYLRKYSDLYDIPYFMAKRVAKEETGFTGIYHYNYDPFQTSFAGAVGAMQVMPSTGLWIMNNSISLYDLMYDIETNVNASLKYSRYLHDNYKDWEITWSCYNQGVKGEKNINKYAKNIVF